MVRDEDGRADADGTTGNASGSAAADEAVRLVGALRDLVSGPAAEHLATGSAECQVCPFCRAVALLRDADPQAIGRVAESVVSMVAAAAAVAEPVLRSLVDTAISTAQAAAARPEPTGDSSRDSAGDSSRDSAGDSSGDSAGDAEQV